LCERIADASFVKKKRSLDGNVPGAASVKRRIALACINSPHTEHHTSNATADPSVGLPCEKENHAKSATCRPTQSESLPMFEYHRHVQLHLGLMPPVILRSMLYGIVRDATQADRELDGLKRRNIIREFKFVGSQDDYALVFAEDYLKHFLSFKHSFLAKLGNDAQQAPVVFDLFLDRVLPTYFDVSISKEQLAILMYGTVGSRSNSGSESSGPSHPSVDDDITVLISGGFLALKDVDTFWFAVPNAGRFVRWCLDGRREVFSLFQRSKWKELMLQDLELKQLKTSPLGAAFHVKDLIGKGLLQSEKTHAGVLVRCKGTAL